LLEEALVVEVPGRGEPRMGIERLRVSWATSCELLGCNAAVNHSSSPKIPGIIYIAKIEKKI
jgi:hypothetical protein